MVEEKRNTTERSLTLPKLPELSAVRICHRAAVRNERTTFLPTHFLQKTGSRGKAKVFKVHPRLTVKYVMIY